MNVEKIRLPASKLGPDYDMTEITIYRAGELLDLPPVMWIVDTTDIHPETYNIKTRQRDRHYVNLNPTQVIGRDYSGPIIEFQQGGDVACLRRNPDDDPEFDSFYGAIKDEIGNGGLSGESYRWLSERAERAKQIN
ncbi:MAG: hypothetical protein KKC05_03530 [Nanoarchaeota archaeon]|nr:hypothetical protein [Nanoarchaeota archaeon]